jgi:outer membrane biosynthesis protein TonB
MSFPKHGGALLAAVAAQLASMTALASAPAPSPVEEVARAIGGLGAKPDSLETIFRCKVWNRLRPGAAASIHEDYMRDWVRRIEAAGTEPFPPADPRRELKGRVVATVSVGAGGSFWRFVFCPPVGCSRLTMP